MGAVVVLAVAAIMLRVLVVQAGSQPQLAPAPARPNPTTAPVSQSFFGATEPAEIPVLIIVVGSTLASEVETMLEGESQTRRLMGEHPRQVDLIIVSDVEEAEAILWAVNEQAALPGVKPVSAVVVAAPVL
jgi:hypothetical protein